MKTQTMSFLQTATVALAVAALAAAPALAQGAETLILFDPSGPETPESIVFDHDDNAYISLALTGRSLHG